MNANSSATVIYDENDHDDVGITLDNNAGANVTAWSSLVPQYIKVAHPVYEQEKAKKQMLLLICHELTTWEMQLGIASPPTGTERYLSDTSLAMAKRANAIVERIVQDFPDDPFRRVIF